MILTTPPAFGTSIRRNAIQISQRYLASENYTVSQKSITCQCADKSIGRAVVLVEHDRTTANNRLACSRQDLGN